MATAVQGRYQRTIEITITPEPPEGWPENKYTSPAVIRLPSGQKFAIKRISGNARADITYSSAQAVIDDTATWEEVVATAAGLAPAEFTDGGEAVKLATTAIATFEIMRLY